VAHKFKVGQIVELKLRHLRSCVPGPYKFVISFLLRRETPVTRVTASRVWPKNMNGSLLKVSSGLRSAFSTEVKRSHAPSSSSGREVSGRCCCRGRVPANLSPYSVLLGFASPRVTARAA
jgi:hypothetical protein